MSIKLTISRLFLLYLILTFSLEIQAQETWLGFKAGISIPNLTSGGAKTPLNTGYSSRQGPDFAIFADFKISRRFSLYPMIEYSSQGGKKSGLQALTVPSDLIPMFPPGQVPQYLYANYKSEAKLNYLMIPLLAKYEWNLSQTPLSLYLNAGPFVSLLLSAKQITRGDSQFYTDPLGQMPLAISSQSLDNTENIKDQLHPLNWGIAGNIGVNYQIDRSKIFIEGGGNYGFSNIQKATENGKNNTGAATVNIGYAYNW
jgi:hypothetical protein